MKMREILRQRRCEWALICRLWSLALIAALALLAAPAYAEHSCPPSGTSIDGVCPVTVGTSVLAVLNVYPTPGGSGYRQIAVDNESTSANCAVCFGASCTPALNTAGSFTIPAGMTRTWSIPFGSGGGYNDPMRGICSAASTPLTVQAQ
ncbi:MAG TPA: hypothetical protein VGR70_09895 [Stellaceae bacterium]|nr:hypothetical protein [Stellaceae bacterium]